MRVSRLVVGIGLLAVSSLSLSHYYLTRQIQNPTPIVGAPVVSSPSTVTQWYCVNANGQPIQGGGPHATQAAAEAPCGAAVASDGVTRYLEERVTTTATTTQTTRTRRAEVLGSSSIKVSDAHAGLITVGGPVIGPPSDDDPDPDPDPDPEPSVGCADGDVIVAESPSQTHVAAAISAASVGDTVSVPAGTGTWNSLSINKAVCLEGAGIDETVITLGTSNTMTKQSTGPIYVRGFTFSRSGGGNSSHGWTIGGNWLNTHPIIIEEVEHIVSNSGLYDVQTIGGVIWAKNTFSALQDDSVIRPKDVQNGDQSWIKNSTFGMDDTDGRLNLYIEDNYFYGGANQAVDADDGARIVYRYNRADYSSFNTHGLATSATGIRHFEVYGNQFRNNSAGGWTGGAGTSDISNQNWAIWIRGGTGVIFENAIDNIANSHWGTGKDEARFYVRAAHDNSGSAYGTQSPPVAKYSAGCGFYPRERQIGQSWDESLTNSVGINGGNGDYITDPIYVWGNTGAGTTNGFFVDFTTSTSSWSGCNTGTYGTPASFVQEGRDYVKGEKPNYTPYTYPHPLRQTTGKAY